ncbi:GNAT family N-acetyltransferase [Planococcus sp. ISL-110]|uniref:GNAT family N-acetyltransferase n=1 Tax=Planococcus sp. ISL-110 TaxID=2819167 RepID=UPI001BE59720|nr:GNAT family N-acetyltransferase [Planococcus sp. ISL-110]MBT2571531.1 acetyltransferase [Planococcus sp. ISL-110]
MLYECEFFDNGLGKKISFRKVDFNQDVEMIHTWMQEEHIHPFWHLNTPIEQFRNHLEKALEDSHQTLFIGCLDDVPMSYWESYWVKGDILEKVYHSSPFDQGIHLLIGEREYLGKGYALPLLQEMVRFQFQQKNTEKVMTEPDIRNEKMIYVFKKCGFTAICPVDLPDKTGLLMECTREVFEKRWNE